MKDEYKKLLQLNTEVAVAYGFMRKPQGGGSGAVYYRHPDGELVSAGMLPPFVWSLDWMATARKKLNQQEEVKYFDLLYDRYGGGYSIRKQNYMRIMNATPKEHALIFLEVIRQRNTEVVPSPKEITVRNDERESEMKRRQRQVIKHGWLAIKIVISLLILANVVVNIGSVAADFGFLAGASAMVLLSKIGI